MNRRPPRGGGELKTLATAVRADEEREGLEEALPYFVTIELYSGDSPQVAHSIAVAAGHMFRQVWVTNPDGSIDMVHKDNLGNLRRALREQHEGARRDVEEAG